MFFCGAGISMNAGLPSFRGLTEKVLKKLSISKTDPLIKTELKNKNFDRVFQTLINKYGRDKVIPYITDILDISDYDSIANDINNHYYIATLARVGSKKPKIVTTNFDTIFSYVLQQQSIQLTEYIAPALCIPSGEDWQGLIHLHGKLHEHGDIVLSSGDFGQAYLKQGWASRFLTTLFENNVVCFVGYSADDVVVRYMLDALNAEKYNNINTQGFPIYCIVGEHQGKDTEWQNLGIFPITYDVCKNKKKKNHQQLTNLLNEIQLHFADPIKKTLDDFKSKLKTLYGQTHTSSNANLPFTNVITPKLTQQEQERLLFLLSSNQNNFDNAKYFFENDPVPTWNAMEYISKLFFTTQHLRRFGIDDTEYKRLDSTENPDNQKLKFSLIKRPLPTLYAG